MLKNLKRAIRLMCLEEFWKVLKGALAGGLGGGGAVMSPVGPGQSCDGGPGGKPPRSSKDLVL